MKKIFIFFIVLLFSIAICNTGCTGGNTSGVDSDSIAYFEGPGIFGITLGDSIEYAKETIIYKDLFCEEWEEGVFSTLPFEYGGITFYTAVFKQDGYGYLDRISLYATSEDNTIEALEEAVADFTSSTEQTYYDEKTNELWVVISEDPMDTVDFKYFENNQYLKRIDLYASNGSFTDYTKRQADRERAHMTAEEIAEKEAEFERIKREAGF